MAGLYASQHPDRVESLFMISPSGTGEVPDDKLDPYQVRFSDSQHLASKEEVDHILDCMRRGVSYAERIKAMPFDEAVEMIKGYWRRKSILTEDMLSVLAAYHLTALKEKGVIEGASLLCFKFQGIAKHPLVRPDRLGNKDLDFPIAIAYGDRDWLYSEDGGDHIVRESTRFATGESQLFLIDNSGHSIFFDNPRELERVMIGFLEGTLKGVFKEKPRDMWIAPKL